MDNWFQRAAESFLVNLIGVDTMMAREYFAEIALNQKFHSRVEENRSVFGRSGRSSWDFSIGTQLGMILYAICRRQKPDIVVETGVANGVSSSYILCAMEENKHGQLYSIDQPWWKQEQSGWMIPDYLRRRWHLVLGKSSETLAPLLEEAAVINIFLQDSDHSYKNMLWEFQTAWTYLKTGGLLLSHNIDTNNAFSDFCQEHAVKVHLLTIMGGTVKS